MKKWKCTICGYIHEGAEPPEKCPVCGADKSEFIELTEESTSEPAVDENPPVQDKKLPPVNKFYNTVTGLMVKHLAHPISVHIPNGLLPVSVFFIFLSLFFDSSKLGQAAFYNLVVVVLAMPGVIFSGYVDWQKKFGGNLTQYFMIKMICGGVVSLTSLIIVIWGLVNPEIITSTAPYRTLFFLICLVMLSAAGIAGFIGGKLVFEGKKES